MKYKFFHKKNQNKEAIGVVKSNSQEEAEAIFSERKKLPLQKFLKLFGVKKLNNE